MRISEVHPDVQHLCPLLVVGPLFALILSPGLTYASRHGAHAEGQAVEHRHRMGPVQLRPHSSSGNPGIAEMWRSRSRPPVRGSRLFSGKAQGRD